MPNTIKLEQEQKIERCKWSSGNLQGSHLQQILRAQVGWLTQH